MDNIRLLGCAFALLISGAPAMAEVPEPCRAVGYSVETFKSEFAYRDQAFDDDDSYLPGHQWYRWNWFNIKPNKQLTRILPDGSISAQGDFEGHLVSAARSPDPRGFVGTAFGGGACVEVRLRFDPTPRGPSEPHPSFWAMAKEHLDGSGDDQWPGKTPGFTHFAEWDILEYFKVHPPAFLSSWIEWYGPYIAAGELKVGDEECHRPFCSRAHSFNPSREAFPADIDWNEWQTVVGVWVPATDDRPGCIQTFMNGRSIAPPYCWKNGILGQERSEPLDFSVIDRQHMVLVISSGSSSPIFVRSVHVYQRSDRENLSH